MEVTRIFDLPKKLVDEGSTRNLFCNKENDEWFGIDAHKYLNYSTFLSKNLLKKGVKKGDNVVIITHNNRWEWNISDIGILQIGAKNVSIYPTISDDELIYIMNHCEASICFVSNIELFERIKKLKSELKYLKDTFSFEKIPGCESWRTLIEDNDIEDKKIEEIKAGIDENEIATIIYTSGTTGQPKGVLLSHKNIVSNIMGSLNRLPSGKIERAFSFLPVCHIFERTLNYIYQYFGITSYYAQSMETIIEDVQDSKPHIMTVVPRLLEKVYAKIIEKGNELSGFKRKMFDKSLELCKENKPFNNSLLYKIKRLPFDLLVYKKWRNALGGNIRILFSGSAALSVDLNRIFNTAGIFVLEGYGLTETSPVVSVNEHTKAGFKMGTVGKPIDNVEVKLSEEGEILVKGPNVMVGYYRSQEKTKEVMTDDGYLKTGDIGKIDEDGFLWITDRKKEMFKTSGGKYIAPQVIENKIKLSKFIEQVIVLGEGKKMPVALVHPDWNFMEEWCAKNNIKFDENNVAELIANPKIISEIDKEIKEVNNRLGKWEQIKKFEIVPDIWSIESGLLTPTLKLRRIKIKTKYNDLYESMFLG